MMSTGVYEERIAHPLVPSIPEFRDTHVEPDAESECSSEDTGDENRVPLEHRIIEGVSQLSTVS